MTTLTSEIIVRRFSIASYFLGLLAAVLAVCVLVGWTFDIVLLKSVDPGWPAAKANSAVSYLIGGIALFIHHWIRPQSRYRIVVDLAGGSIALIGLLTLVQYAFGVGLGIDQLLFRDSVTALFTSDPGRMAPNTALILVLTGVGMILSTAHRSPAAGQVLASTAILLSLLATIGYIYDVEALRGPNVFTQISLPSALTGFVFCIGILLMVPDKGPVSILATNTIGGMMARRLIPMAVLVPTVLGYLRLLGERQQIYGVEFGVALYAVANIVFFAFIIWWTTLSLYRISVSRSEAESELRRFKFISDHASDAHFLIDRHNRLQYVNQVAARELGYTQPELLEMTMGTLLADTKDTAGRIRDFLELEELQQTPPFESRIRRKDGSTFAVSISVNRVTFSGEPYIYWVARDITELKAVHEELEEQNRILETINGVNTILAGELEFEKLVQTVTDAGTELTGAQVGAFFYTVIEDNGQKRPQYSLSGAHRSAFDSMHRTGTSGMFHSTFLGDGIVRIDDVLEHPPVTNEPPYDAVPEGHVPVRSFLSTAVVSRNEEVLGGLFFGHEEPNVFDARSEMLIAGIADQAAIAIENARLFMAANSELKDRKRAEAQLRELNETLEERVRERTAALEQTNEQLTAEVADRTRAEKALERSNLALKLSNRELQDFAYAASHDLQEPLRKVSSFADLLIADYSDRLDDNGRHLIDRMQDAALRMSRLIEDLLSFSRVKTRAQPFERVDLKTTLSDVLDDLQVALAESSGSVEVGDLPELEADPTQMRQLFQNLLSNALKFRRADVAPEVTVCSTLIENNGSSEYRIEVQDNGIGFEQQYLDRIFSPFQRLHGKSAYPGTGIGLAICRRIVERHHGTLTARSEPGRGSTFVVTLPADQESYETSFEASTPSASNDE